ncbi:phage tail assembly chaperone G [Staphylococcus xylosus]
MTKRNFIKLHAKDSKGNIIADKFETFLTPDFIPFRKIYEATGALEKLEDPEAEQVSEREGMDMMMELVIDIYGNKFTKDDLLDRMHSPDTLNELKGQLEFVSQGQMADERKKQLAKMI